MSETARAERIVAAAPAAHPDGDEVQALKAELFKAAQHAGIGLKLLGTDRAVLTALVACFHSRPLNGSPYVVWPSDQTLVDRTRRSRRTIHYSLNRLIDLGLIARESSATRRRFAITRRDRTVVKAFGIDLEPLLTRAHDLSAAAAGVRQQRQRETDLGTMIAAERAGVKRALAILEKTKSESARDWQGRFALLDAETPRWSKCNRPSDVLLARWSAERSAIEAELPKPMNFLFFSGQIAHQGTIGCAPVETLPKILNEVCNNAAGDCVTAADQDGTHSTRRLDTASVAPKGLGEARIGVAVVGADLPSPLPDAKSAPLDPIDMLVPLVGPAYEATSEADIYDLGYQPHEVQAVLGLIAPLRAAIDKSGRPLESASDLVRGGHRLRRVIGLHQSAWVEALAMIGELDTYMLAYWTVQRTWLAEKGLVPSVANAAGLFRSSAQKMASGAFDLRKALASVAHKAGAEIPSDVANLPLGNPNRREDSESNPFLRDSRGSACYRVNKKDRFSGRLHLPEILEQTLESKMTH
nr:helix-turn-helix domain-containing protein [Microvirga tunisiensis]